MARQEICLSAQQKLAQQNCVQLDFYEWDKEFANQEIRSV